MTEIAKKKNEIAAYFQVAYIDVSTIRQIIAIW
jgi:hypothetical protein